MKKRFEYERKGPLKENYVVYHIGTFLYWNILNFLPISVFKMCFQKKFFFSLIRVVSIKTHSFCRSDLKHFFKGTINYCSDPKHSLKGINYICFGSKHSLKESFLFCNDSEHSFKSTNYFVPTFLFPIETFH